MGWLYDRMADRYRGGQWLTIADAEAGAAWTTPIDFVRLEIEAALTRNVRVIPILVDGATMPHADELPASLAGLVRRQAFELSPARFDFDPNRLLKVLDTILAEVRTTHDDAAAASTLEANAPDQNATHITQAQAPGSDASTAQSETLVEPYDDPEYTAALAAYFTERWDTAVDLLTRVLDRYPHHPQTAERLAEAQRQQRLAGWDAASRQAAEQGRCAEAVDALEHISSTSPWGVDMASAPFRRRRCGGPSYPPYAARKHRQLHLVGLVVLGSR